MLNPAPFRPPPVDPPAVYVVLSHRLFLTTGSLKDAVVPHDDNRLLARNLLMMGAVAGMAACFGLLMVEARKMLIL